MSDKPIGTMFVELDLDMKEYTKKQQQIIKGAKETALSAEKNFRTLGVTSDTMFKAQAAQAENAYRMITNSAKTSAAERQRAEVAYHAKIKELNTQMHGEQVSLISKLKSNWLAIGAAIGAAYAAFNAGKQFIDASLAMERINSTMKATMGTTQAAAREVQFLREESQRLGLTFQDTALAYAKFAASTRNTSIEGEQARKVFVGVSEAVTALKLTSDEANGIFLALSQMMSKGKISAEELSGQLGERLPGAVRLTAEAMNLTTAELLDQMKKGELYASDVLPKLAEQLHKTYGTAATEAAQQGQAVINRFNDAVFESKRVLGDVLMPVLTKILNMMSGFLNYVTSPKLAYYFKNFGTFLTGSPEEIARVKAGMGGVSSQKSAAEIAAENTTNALRKQKEAAAAAAGATKKAGDDAAKAAEKAAKEAERLAVAWGDFKDKIQAEIDMSGMDELNKDLKQNEIEANRLLKSMKDQPAAIQEQAKALIEQSRALKDRNAYIEDGIRKEKEQAEQRKKVIEETEKEATRIRGITDAYNSVTDSLDPLTAATRQYNEDLQSIIAYETETGTAATTMRQKLINAFNDVALEIRKAELALGGFKDGLTLAWITLTESAQTWAEMTVEVVTDAAYTMRYSFSDIFFDGMMGELRDLEDYFDSFCRSIARSFANAMGQMASNWAMFGELAGTGSALTGGTGGIMGMLTKAFGSPSSLISKIPYLGKAYDWISGALGFGGIASGLAGWTSGAGSLALASAPVIDFGALMGSWGAGTGIGAGATAGAGTGIMSSLSGFMTNPWTIGAAAALGGIYALIQGAGLGKTSIIHENRGIELSPTTVENLMNGEGVYGQSYYQYVKKKKSYTGHVKRRLRKEYSPLDEETDEVFQSLYASMAAGLTDIGKALGDDASNILAYNFGTQIIELTNLTAEQSAAAIATWATGVTETAVHALFGDFFDQFMAEGENVYDTAVRVVNSMTLITDGLDTIDIAFSNVGREAILMSENLIAMAGSIENLTGFMSTYYQAFFSDSERQADLMADLTEVLKEQGLGLPDTRDGFRDLVESMDMTTTWGQEAFVTLMALAGKADAYYDYLEQAAEDAARAAEDAAKRREQQLTDADRLNKDYYATLTDYQRDWYKIFSGTTTLEEIDRRYHEPAFGYASGGSFGGGWRVVGENGPELEYTGPSAILSNKDSKSLLDVSSLLAEIKALREEVRSGNYAVALNTARAGKIIDKWDNEGLPTERT